MIRVRSSWMVDDGVVIQLASSVIPKRINRCSLCRESGHYAKTCKEAIR